ncbi:MAG: pilus (MSHA type) biogenesis protein MshL [Pseudomonadota bacterium]
MKQRLLAAKTFCDNYFSWRFFLLSLMGLSLGVTLTACEHLRFEPKPSQGHISKPDGAADTANIPEPTRAAPPLPAPQATRREETHTVVVSDVPVRELLFSLARDADLNLDIDNDVDGLITLNAVNQPLPAILERIAASGNLRYAINNKVLRIRKDAPFLRNYRIDYLNMARTSNGSVSVSTQISATGQGAGEGAGGGGGDNNSATEVKNVSENAFWSSLQKNIGVIISGNREEVAAAADGSNPDIMLNRESGIMGIRASEKQHEEIQRFIDEVQNSAQRQVLIEATIAEVKLNDRYQAGINWSLVRDTAGHNILFDIANTVNDVALGTPPAFSIGASTRLDGNLLQTTLQALQTFGDVQIMSSPKVMALNNQTALLKVVDNLVYFTVEVNIEAATALGATRTITYETKVNTVPVGFVMSVTPYISEHGAVTLNVRPTISRVIKQMRDPNPALAEAKVISEIPVIQVREVESVLKVNSGDVAVIGGLMQDEVSNNKRGIPVLSKIPLLGALFRYEDDSTDKTELVIFIKPIVIKNASLAGDLSQFRDYLPSSKNKPSASEGE